MSLRIGPLSPNEANRTLAHRLAPRIDRIRQIATRFGIRSDRVFLVWTKYTGDERGEGAENEVARVEILPTPKVSDETAITENPFSAGTLPVGSLRVEDISALFTQEELMGRTVPVSAELGSDIDEPYDFFYEVVSDGRGGGSTGCGTTPGSHPRTSSQQRAKYRLLGTPDRVEGNVSWTISIERISEDRNNRGESRIGADE